MVEKEISVSGKPSDANAIETKRKKDDAAQMNMIGVQLSRWAENKVQAKRKKKGLSELKPRQKPVFQQLFVHGGSMTFATLAMAPLERVRIIHQT